MQAILHDIDSEDESLITAMPFLENLHDLVRTCQFTKFWSEFKGSSEAANILHSNPNYFPSHKALVPVFRQQFASTIAASFRRIRPSQLARWLDLTAADVPTWAKSAGWEVDGDFAVVPANGDNDVKAGVVKENVELKRELHRWLLHANPHRAYQARRRRGVLGLSRTRGRGVEMMCTCMSWIICVSSDYSDESRVCCNR
jgi:hypothetical protein